jgi:hypothetical protein
MIKQYQADGTFTLIVENSDVEFMSETGRKTGTIPKTFTDEYVFNETYAAAVESATVNEYVAPEPEEEPEVRVTIPRMEIIERLDALGKFEDALTALQSDAKLYQRWLALNDGVYIDDADMITLLTEIGVDPTTVLF